MDNLQKVAASGVNLTEMSEEEKQVVQSLSGDELDTLLKAKSKFDVVCKQKGKMASQTSMKIL